MFSAPLQALTLNVFYNESYNDIIEEKILQDAMLASKPLNASKDL